MVKIDEPKTWVFPAKINYKPNDNIFKGLNFNTAKNNKDLTEKLDFFNNIQKNLTRMSRTNSDIS
jgi:hypothetical protein